MQARWEPDRALTIRQACRAIGSQFPEIEVGRLEFLGSGWEHDAFISSDGWVFRFPRRAEYANSFQWERGLHELVAGRLSPVVVPRIELWGAPGPDFPYRFAGHRHVPGLRADHPDVSLHPMFTRQLGVALSQIHSVAEDEARQKGVQHDADGAKEWFVEVRELAPSLRGLDPRVDSAVDWLSSGPELPADYSGPPRFVHNDLCPDHILVSPDSGRLSGIIDWTDAALGDPVFDFAVLVAWQGWGFYESVRGAYAGALDRQFDTRLAFLARVLSLDWLWECQQQAADTEKHVRWITNAFGR